MISTFSSLFTDGSTDAQLSAASCIFKRPGEMRHKFVFLLPPMRGDEIELVAGVLGLLCAGVIAKSKNGPLRWHTDNKSIQLQALRAITQKEVGASMLWKLWWELAAGTSLVPVWVRGHAGHKENEACDHVCAWVRKKGLELLRDYGEGPIGSVLTHQPQAAWRLIDLRQHTLAAQDTSEIERVRERIRAVSQK